MTAPADAGRLSPLFGGQTKPYVRWWWLAGPFHREDIVRQLEWIRAHGFGGVELAWIWPTWLGRDDSAAPGIEWLSPAWSDLVAFTKEQADRLGLGCDFTFGSSWPFGGAAVAPDDASKTFYGRSAQRLHGAWEDPLGWRLFVLDHLHRPALERYAAALLPAFKPALAGRPSALFCDSLEVDTRDLWSPALWEEFAATYGYNLEEYVETIDENPAVRYDYQRFRAAVMLREFYEPFAQICRQAGAVSRVQCHGAPVDLLAAYAAVDVPETEAILFEPTFARIAASAAVLADKPVVSCETFTCIYGFISPGNLKPIRYWKREQTADLKLLADAVFAQGVNQILWHGMPFNGPTGRNEFYASVHVGPDAAFVNDLPAFNDYLTRVAGYLQRGRPYTSLAVYLPLEDVWMQGSLPPEQRTPGANYWWELRQAMPAAETEGYHPLWISLPFLRSASVADGQLVIGQSRFSGLYVDGQWLDGAAVGEILRLARGGLPIVLKQRPKQPGFATVAEFAAWLDELERLPNVHRTLRQTGMVPLIDGDELPYYWARQTDDSLYIFLAHPLARTLKYPMAYGQSRCEKTILRPIQIQVGPAVHALNLVFEPYQSLLLQLPLDGAPTLVDIAYRPPEPTTDPAG